MIRNTLLFTILCLGGFCADVFVRPSSGQSIAQAPAIIPAPTNDPMAVKRGLNLARGTAIRLNGGLNQYRPARCMFASSVNNRCLAQKDDSGMVFHFPGGAPGWEETGTPPTIVTILKVAPDGRAITQQIYNGPPGNIVPR